MNLFMRSVSILASAAIMSLAPLSSFAAEDGNMTFNVSGTAGGIENSDCDKFVSCQKEHSNCNLPPGIKECKVKPKEPSDSGSQGGPAPSGGDNGGTNNNPQNNANKEEQPQNSSQGSGANCSDRSKDPQNVQAKNRTPVPNGAKGEGHALGDGNESACQGINSNFADRAKQAHEAGQKVGLQGTDYPALESALQEYAKNRDECLDSQANAGNQCLDGLSPNTGEAAAGVNNVLGQVGQNASDTCGKANKAMDLARAGLAAFNGQCGAAQGECSSSCSKASKGVADLVKKAKAVKPNCNSAPEPQKPQCESYMQQYQQALTEGIAEAEKEMKSSDATSVAGKQKICDQKYTANIGSALQGIMSMLAGMQQSAKCEEETEGVPEDKGTVADKCILPENAALPECICKANPRTVGCSTAYQAMNSTGKNELGGGMGDKVNVDPSADGATLDGALPGIEHASRNPSGDGAGAPMGGGSAGLGGSSVGNGKGTADAGTGEGSGLNANILSGTGGGGGGAGFGGGGAGDQYRQYLPGGAKDPAKSLTGQQAWKNEVTGQGGKSNWEKVKDRYRDNRSSLLNN